jgi:hypothetical protein
LNFSLRLFVRLAVRRFWIFDSVSDNEYGIYLNALCVRVMAAVRDPWPRDAGICEGSLSFAVALLLSWGESAALRSFQALGRIV